MDPDDTRPFRRPGNDPSEQLEWARQRRHEDDVDAATAQFPVYDDAPSTREFEALGPGAQEERLDEHLDEPRPNRGGSRVALFAGAGLLGAAVLFAGLAAAGVGPVRDVFGTSRNGTATSTQSGMSGSDRAAVGSDRTAGSDRTGGSDGAGGGDSAARGNGGAGSSDAPAGGGSARSGGSSNAVRPGAGAGGGVAANGPRANGAARPGAGGAPAGAPTPPAPPGGGTLKPRHAGRAPKPPAAGGRNAGGAPRPPSGRAPRAPGGAPTP